MRRLYNILFGFFFAISAPYYFWKMWRRGGWRAGFEQRFGEFGAKTKQSLTNRHVLWLHAVSVGEVNLCTQLIRVIERRLPNAKLVVSTTTSTGMGELQRKLPSHIGKIYYPIDRRKFVWRSVNVIHPEAVVLVEAEIWPNFLWRLMDRETPVFLVNARLSERSFRGYKRFGFLFRPLFASFAGVGAQNEADAARLRELGCRPEAIRVVGSLKFDAAKLDERRLLDVDHLLRQLGVSPEAPLLVAGSTHAGEEAILGRIFLRLRKHIPNLFLIVVPRHQERGKEASRDLDAAGVRHVLRGNITASTLHPAGDIQALLVNTTGELKYFYEQATVVFVGKSLTALGGQNPIEPASMGRAVVYGPHMENFEPIATEFAQEQAAMRVADEAGLENALLTLLKDPALREQMGARARQVVRRNQGSIERTADLILEGIRHTDLFAASTGELPD